MNQDKLNALRVAGNMLRPILEAERGSYGSDIVLSLFGSDFRFSQVLHTHGFAVATGQAPEIDAAFLRFLENRCATVRDKDQEERERAEFETWRGQRELKAA